MNQQHPLSYSQLVDMRRTEKGEAYRRTMRDLHAMTRSSDPKDRQLVASVNADMVHLRDVTPATVHQNATMSNVSVQYANDEYIGDQLLPLVQVARKSDVYYIYPKRERMAYPPDELDAKGEAHELSETRETSSYACVTYGYKNYLDAETLENQDAPLNEMLDLTEACLEGLAFRRELRQATVLTAAGNFPTGNKATLTGTDQWNDPTGGNPIANIQDAIGALYNGRGPSKLVAYTSLDVWNVLSRHPQILDLFKYGGTAPGLATPQMVAGFFGLDGLLVGKARQDTANIGGTASYSRIWGDYFGILRVADRPSIRNASFGLTLRHGVMEAAQWFDPTKGKKGGWWAKNTCSDDEIVLASDTGYLISDTLA